MFDALREVPVFLGDREDRLKIGTAKVTSIDEKGVHMTLKLTGGQELKADYTPAPWAVFAIDKESFTRDEMGYKP